jgi:anti-anti-sigma regulatory factor
VASNFKLVSHRKNDRLHFKLNGDFEGSSAFELIHALSESKADLHKIIVDTSDLSTNHSFGKNVFKKNIKVVKKRYSRLIFVGKYRHIFVA